MAKLAMKVIHWNETDGIWYDYDLEKKVFFCVQTLDNSNWLLNLGQFLVLVRKLDLSDWFFCISD